MFHSSFAAAVVLTYLSQVALASTTDYSPQLIPNPGNCNASCKALAEVCESCVSYFNETIYAEQQEYWSQIQAQTYPNCRFTPRDASDVSAAIVEFRGSLCPFAVKSGGHASFRGGSNIEDGITIDLSDLTTIEVSSDRTTTHVGTGNRWEDVYAKLDAMKLAVIGGRNGDIGVGGLTLGGGISFFSGFHGWACDNVKNYQVVIANGDIVNANPDENPDLFHALRGGGNNFGVVTRLDLDTFEHGKMWGGSTVYPLTANRTLYDAFYHFNQNPTDPKAALIVSAACVSGLGCFMSNNYDYIDPVVNPPAFENFTSVTNLSDTSRITTLSNLTAELKATQPPGFRQRFYSLTFQNNAELIGDILDMWYEDIQPIINITDFLPAYVVQPLQIPVIQNFAQNGGNALGITEADGPLMIMNTDFQWGLKEDDAQVFDIQTNFMSKSAELAKSRGLLNRYVYQNYAYINQDVFDGYGEQSKNRLLKIQDEYDPEHVFVDLQPGYFKLRE